LDEATTAQKVVVKEKTEENSPKQEEFPGATRQYKVVELGNIALEKLVDVTTLCASIVVKVGCVEI
jgi:hypothetical protein